MPARRVPVVALAITLLVGCVTEFSEVQPRGGWREVAERACMQRRAGIQPDGEGGPPSFERIETESIKLMPAIVDGPCGVEYPLRVTALAEGEIVVTPQATLGCPVTEALEAWFSEAVQPAAIAWIGAPVVEIRQLSNYACRKRNIYGKGYSEHAFGNALDIGEFKFANGRELTIARDWDGSSEARGFLNEIFAGACERFTTTLGPGVNILHYNHIHVDLAEVAPDNSPRMCKPTPEPVSRQRAPALGGAVASDAGPSNTALPGENEAQPVAADTAVPGAD